MLDETAEVVATAGPWAAVLVVTALPYRFAQIVLLERLIELGGEAMHYGHLLGDMANLLMVTALLAMLGRAVWARACRLTYETSRMPGRATWSIRPASLLGFLFVSSLGMLLFYTTALTIIGPPLAILLAGLGIGTMELNERATIRGTMRLVSKYARNVRLLVALFLVFVIGLFVAFVNIAAIFALGCWLAGAFGADTPRWQILLGMNRRFVFILFAGALTAIEPFWIAANVILVRKAGAAESGEDLRLWFRELQGSTNAEQAR